LSGWKKIQGYPRGQQNAGCYPSYRRCVCPKNSQRTFDFLSDYARGFGTRTQSRQNLPGIDWHFFENLRSRRLQKLPSLSFRKKLTPFWRVIDETMKVAKKLTCGIEFLREHRQKEGL